jgi:hypothetical protein
MTISRELTLSSLHDGEEGRNLLQPDQLLIAPHLLGQSEMVHRDESVVGGAGEPGVGWSRKWLFLLTRDY